MTLFDPHKVPFSTRESFHCISWLGDAFWLRNLRGGDEHTNLGRLLQIDVLEDGQPCTADWTLTPDSLQAATPKGTLTFTFTDPNRISVLSRGLGLRLTSGPSKYDYAQETDRAVHICNAAQDIRCEIGMVQGTKALHSPWNGLSADSITLTLSPENGVLNSSIDLFRVAPIPAKPPQGFAGFLAALPPCLPEHARGHQLAAYILWSAFVPAEGALTRPAIYMSKNWMTNIWSWDHCFVARALPPDLAWDQMAVIFDAQHETGRLPDYINDRYALWAFTKPPVHGWTFRQLHILGHEAQVLHWLTLQAQSWLNGPSWQGLPAYRHGNDAGWDNATCFAEGAPVVTPDLATFLILQFDQIAALHQKLGAPEAAATATAQADDLCERLVHHLWTGEAFVARMQGDGRVVTTGDSLLLLLPLLLGPRLPADIRTKLLQGLQEPGRFLTPHGLATEALTSPLYRANGYWRGPIWAPTTMLFVDALDRCGEQALADDIARRYVTLCQQNGMAENHDAQTGEGLHDPAFAWTSAVYLILADRLQRLARITSR